MEPTTASTPGFAGEPNEMVVDLGHQQLIETELANFQVSTSCKATDGDLNLALLSLSAPGMSGGFQRVDTGYLTAEYRDLWDGAFAEIEPTAAGTDASNLDVYLLALRKAMRSRYGGWTAEFGKNRGISDIGGLPYISGGGVPIGPVEVPTEDIERETPPLGDDHAGHGVQVGIADTRIFENPRLGNSYLASPDAILRPVGPVRQGAGHATFIAGIVRRHAPEARLIIEPVLDDNAKGTAWRVATGLMRFLGMGIDVVSLALGTYTRDSRPPLVLARAIERLAGEMVVVAAAGNHGGEPEKARPDHPLTRSTACWPAALPQVCAVAANDGTAKRAPFSPPDHLPWITLTARGVEVVSTFINGDVSTWVDGGTEKTVTFKNDYARWSGTSFAAAAVAGEIARRTIPGRRTAWEARDELLRGDGEAVHIYSTSRDGRAPS